MSDSAPTVTETRHGLPSWRRPGGIRPVEDPVSGEAVALRGTPERAAAVVRRAAPVTTSPGCRLVESVWLVAAIVETSFGLRVLFHAVSANRGTEVVRLLDFVSASLLAPFAGIVDDDRLGNGGRLDISALITMAVYLVAAVIVARFIRIATAPRTPAVA